MKIYAFYLIGDRDFKFESLTDKPNDLVEITHTDSGHPVWLYAYTTSKKDAKLFKKERNMKRFIYKKLEIPDDNMDQFEEEFSYAELAYEPLIYDKSLVGLLILVTDYERSTLETSYIINDMLYSEIMYDDSFVAFNRMEIFKRKLRKSFKQLNFDRINSMIGESDTFDGMNDFSEEWNQLKIFALFFKELLSDMFYDTYCIYEV